MAIAVLIYTIITNNLTDLITATEPEDIKSKSTFFYQKSKSNKLCFVDNINNDLLSPFLGLRAQKWP